MRLFVKVPMQITGKQNVLSVDSYEWFYNGSICTFADILN